MDAFYANLLISYLIGNLSSLTVTAVDKLDDVKEEKALKDLEEQLLQESNRLEKLKAGSNVRDDFQK